MRNGNASIVIGLLVLAAAIGSAQPQSLQQQIVAKERQGLDDLKTGNYDEFASLTADDAVFVDSHGPATKAEVMDHTREFRLSDYSMEDVRFVQLSAKSGLIVYTISETGTSHGKPFSAKVHVSSIWAERGGKWVCVFSQETAAR